MRGSSKNFEPARALQLEGGGGAADEQDVAVEQRVVVAAHLHAVTTFTDAYSNSVLRVCEGRRQTCSWIFVMNLAGLLLLAAVAGATTLYRKNISTSKNL